MWSSDNQASVSPPSEGFFIADLRQLAGRFINTAKALSRLFPLLLSARPTGVLELNMQLRCKDGDLAIVIGDVRGCEGNIGRIVKVRGPSNIHPFVNKVCWKIKPISRKDYLVLELNGTLTKAQITWKDDIVHPDCWLLPIKPAIKEPDNRDGYLEGTEYGNGRDFQGEEGRDVRGGGRSRLQTIADEAIPLRDRWIDARGAARIGSGTKFDKVAVPEPTAEYGEPTEGSVSAVGVHFSKQLRPTLVSSMYGTGLKGA